MLRPVSLFIGLRYTRAKRRNHFISFIALASMIGIALGVAVLITVLSVMNGFDLKIRQQLFSVAPEVTINAPDNFNVSQNWSALAAKLKQFKSVKGAAPYMSGKGMLTNLGQMSAVEVLGISPKVEANVSQLSKKMVKGKLSSLAPGTFNMVVGKILAQNLGLKVGEKVNLFTPQVNTTPLGVFPIIRRFTVSGIFSTNNGFGFDSSLAYINLRDAEKLFPGTAGQGGLHLRLDNIYQAPYVANQVEQALPFGFYVSDWTTQFGSLFKALTMEKTMMFIILMLIVAVAAFNLVASLVMIVNDKRADIAILRTLGATPRTIMMIFIIQGLVVGLIGTLIGILGGIVLSLNATAIVNFIQHVFHVQFISASVYFVNYLPSQLQWHDVRMVGLWAIALSFIATIYPAYVAFKTQPAEALRYE